MCLKMANLSRILNINSLTKLFSSLSVIQSKNLCNPNARLLPAIICQKTHFHSSGLRRDLMEFFDDKKNWGENEVKVGRSWKKEELRIKSNTDLHKLWFVLLKERNMLLTMEHECKEQVALFPNPERVDKVRESMRNLEDVVRERNRAYFELETGETGERPGIVVRNMLGLRQFYRKTEHCMPRFMNRRWQKTHQFNGGGRAVSKFLKLYREKLFLQKRRAAGRNKNHVMGLLKRFPHLDDNILREKYPDVDLEKVRHHKKLLKINPESL